MSTGRALAPEAGLDTLVEVVRDYGAVAEKMNALGPLVDTLGATTKGVTFDLAAQVDYLRAKNGAVRGGVADGRLIRAEARGPGNDPDALGKAVAQGLLDGGAGELIAV